MKDVSKMATLIQRIRGNAAASVIAATALLGITQESNATTFDLAKPDMAYAEKNDSVYRMVEASNKRWGLNNNYLHVLKENGLNKKSIIQIGQGIVIPGQADAVNAEKAAAEKIAAELAAKQEAEEQKKKDAKAAQEQREADAQKAREAQAKNAAAAAQKLADEQVAREKAQQEAAAAKAAAEAEIAAAEASYQQRKADAQKAREETQKNITDVLEQLSQARAARAKEQQEVREAQEVADAVAAAADAAAAHAAKQEQEVIDPKAKVDAAVAAKTAAEATLANLRAAPRPHDQNKLASASTAVQDSTTALAAAAQKLADEEADIAPAKLDATAKAALVPPALAKLALEQAQAGTAKAYFDAAYARTREVSAEGRLKEATILVEKSVWDAAQAAALATQALKEAEAETAEANVNTAIAKGRGVALAGKLVEASAKNEELEAKIGVLEDENVKLDADLAACAGGNVTDMKAAVLHFQNAATQCTAPLPVVAQTPVTAPVAANIQLPQAAPVPTAAPAPVAATPVTRTAANLVVVATGKMDSVSRIAKEHGVCLADVIALNPEIKKDPQWHLDKNQKVFLNNLETNKKDCADIDVPQTPKKVVKTKKGSSVSAERNSHTKSSGTNSNKSQKAISGDRCNITFNEYKRSPIGRAFTGTSTRVVASLTSAKNGVYNCCKTFMDAVKVKGPDGKMHGLQYGGSCEPERDGGVETSTPQTPVGTGGCSCDNPPSGTAGAGAAVAFLAKDPKRVFEIPEFTMNA